LSTDQARELSSAAVAMKANWALRISAILWDMKGLRSYGA
jgi:hypothetical protein